MEFFDAAAILQAYRSPVNNQLLTLSAGSHADRARESGQAGNRAAISESLVVLWGNPAGLLFFYFIFFIFYFKTMDREELKKRTKVYAHRCVKLAIALPDTPLGRHVRMQLIKCGTSVGANYRSACVAQTRASFTSKLNIVLEEADESCFWLEFIVEEKLLSQSRVTALLSEGKELTSLFASSTRTLRSDK